MYLVVVSTSYIMRLLLPLILLCSLLACQPSENQEASSASAAEVQKPLTVYLVRHAEKANSPEDPGLTEAGKERAEVLAHMLSSTGIRQVYSSDYARTRETAVPVAVTLGLETQLYDPRNLAPFAEQLLEAGGAHLVVGHSNTTPQLVELLGGTPGTAITEAEYDRLYILSVAANKEVNTQLLRFGKPYSPAE
ncbi:MAG TPA: hypothetical protein DCR93_17975 [Cytophagales bacterium]|nr:hypothetical protein [Cytophagales bacterium]HAP61298.1 hypothetical protein [Cytophagales bacterium]